jgi:hypothetical protein
MEQRPAIAAQAPSSGPCDAVLKAAGAQGPVRRAGAIHAALWSGAALAIVGAGLLLWHARGEAVFFDMLASALALCF